MLTPLLVPFTTLPVLAGGGVGGTEASGLAGGGFGGAAASLDAVPDGDGVVGDVVGLVEGTCPGIEGDAVGVEPSSSSSVATLVPVAHATAPRETKSKKEAGTWNLEEGELEYTRGTQGLSLGAHVIN